MEKDYKSLDNFLKLCRKAQEMIFDLLQTTKHSYFFDIYELDETIGNMTPIEQIFDIGQKIKFMTDSNMDLYIEPQVDIVVKDKHYIVDFLIDGYEEWSYEKNHPIPHILKKSLVIELDGKDFHSSKEQMNYDYQRENDIKLAGYDVMRFTGSQIYNDINGCLSKVYQYIKLAEKE